MTRYLDTNDLSRLMRTTGLQATLSGLATRIRTDFLRWEQFQKSARVANHSNDGVIELMPTSDGDLYAFKYVNGHPRNTRDGLLTVMAFGVLADVSSGMPLLLSELTFTTALRTAATSAMAARTLARPDSRVMALIGNGAQSEFQSLAFAALNGITEIRAFDIDPAASAKLMRNLASVPGLTVLGCHSVRDAVRGADIVTTVTADKANATILSADMIEPGMHINAVGGDCPGKTELAPGVLELARVFVEFEPQTRIEGDIQQMPADFPVTELWQVLTGRAPGREHATQVTVFDSVGFALEDFSALCYLHEQSLAQGIGSQIDLVPTPADPKDLYGAAMFTSGLRPQVTSLDTSGADIQRRLHAHRRDVQKNVEHSARVGGEVARVVAQ